MNVSSPELEAFLWARLQVISVEDIGLGNVHAPVLVETLYQMHQRLARPHGDRYLFAIHAVRVLCQSEKERGSDELLNWVSRAMTDGGKLPDIPDYALDMHTRRGQEMGRGMEHFLAEASKVAPEMPGRDTTYRERLLTMVKSK
jgi:replication-associated recombination protein RarA